MQHDSTKTKKGRRERELIPLTLEEFDGVS